MTGVSTHWREEAGMKASMARVWIIILSLVVLGLMAGRASGYTMTVDGDVSDWGIAPGAFGSSDWEPLPGTQGIWGPPEDYAPGTSGGYVYPGYGGQEFDAEAFYLTYDENCAYIAVVCGMPPSGAQGHRPGDIALDFGLDGTWDLGIATTSYGGKTAGGLYTDITWASGLWGGVSDPTAIITGTLVCAPDTTSLFYSAIGGTGHYVIEASIPLDQLPSSEEGAPVSFRGHWTQTCGNDAVDAECSLPPGSIIPEPMTCTLMGIGFVALLGSQARRRRKGKGAARA